MVKTHGFCNSNAAECVMVISSFFRRIYLQCTQTKNVLFSFALKPPRYDDLINWIWIAACYRIVHSIGHSCPQGNSLGLLYALANKFALLSQVYSTLVQVSLPTLLSYGDAGEISLLSTLSLLQIIFHP